MELNKIFCIGIPPLRHQPSYPHCVRPLRNDCFGKSFPASSSCDWVEVSLCLTDIMAPKLIRSKYVWCRWWDLNPHGVATAGFWVQCVCRFATPAFNYLTIISYSIIDFKKNIIIFSENLSQSILKTKEAFRFEYSHPKFIEKIEFQVAITLFNLIISFLTISF